MSRVADQLSQVVEKTAKLIELCATLQEENDLLKIENESLKIAVETGKKLNSELEERLRAVKLARSFEGNSEKSLDIKQKISEFVREIDKCMVLLKK